MFTVHLLLET